MLDDIVSIRRLVLFLSISCCSFLELSKPTKASYAPNSINQFWRSFQWPMIWIRINQFMINVTPDSGLFFMLSEILRSMIWKDCLQVVKPIVETDISRAASSFAKDSTLIKYRWRYNDDKKNKIILIASFFNFYLYNAKNWFNA